MTFLFHKLIRGIIALFFVLLALGAVVFFIFPLPGQIPVLMYHFIGSEEVAETNGNVISKNTFEKQMNFLKRFGYRVITIKDFDETLSGSRKPAGREIVITFDDGNTSVKDEAIPITNKLNFPVTLFLISQNLKSGTYGSMKTAEVIQLAQNPLIYLGAHSRTHPFLSQISDGEVNNEVIGSKAELESMLNKPMIYFAYPYGDFDQRSMIAAQKAGYRLAFTTSPKKLNAVKSGDYCIPRVKITESASNPIIFWIKVSGIYESYKLWRHHLYQKKQA